MLMNGLETTEIKDLKIINEIPFVLKTGFYGTIALLIGLILFVLDSYKIMDIYTLSGVFVSGVILRLIAYYNKWSIPMI